MYIYIIDKYIYVYIYIYIHIYIYIGGITSAQYIKKYGSLEVLFMQFKEKLMIDKARAYLAGLKKGTCVCSRYTSLTDI
jgi:hypothetical protein